MPRDPFPVPPEITTSTMRLSLQNIQFALPDEDEVDLFSQHFNDAMAVIKTPEGKALSAQNTLGFFKAVRREVVDEARFMPLVQRKRYEKRQDVRAAQSLSTVHAPAPYIHTCVFLTAQHDPCPLAPHARALRVVSASCLRTQNQIFFDEFFRVARDRIKVNKVKLIDEQLKALWCVLDPNDVNWIQFPDVVLFLKRGSDGERAIRRAQKAKEKRERTLAARAANAFIEWAPTRTYRAALEERGVALPGADTLMALAKQINDALEEKRKDEKNKNAVQEKTSGQPTTFKIFKEMDEDRSGFLSFDEFQWALRQKLWLSKSKLSDDMLMAIWCILDWGKRLAATSIFVLGRDTATTPSRTPTREPPCQPPRGRHLRPAWPNYIAHSPRARVCGARI